MMTFEQANQLASSNPFFGADWKALDEEARQGWWTYVHGLIDRHPWRGHPLNPEQGTPFPRMIDGVCVRWDTDPDRYHASAQAEGYPPPLEAVIPSATLVDGMFFLFNRRTRQDLIAMRDLGARVLTVGPIEVEFTGSVSNTAQPDDDPLPSPIWLLMGKYSTLGYYAQTTSTTRRIERA